MDAKKQFQRAIQGLNSFYFFCEDDDLDHVTNFLIDTMGSEIAAETTLRTATAPVLSEEDFHIPYPGDYKAELRKNMSLAGYHVIGLPSEKRSLVHAIADISKEGFRKERDNYRVNLYPELKLAIVIDGRHHLSVAGLKNIAVADAQIIRLNDFADKLTTDGEYWYLEDDDKIHRYEVKDVRLAIMYCTYQYRRDTPHG